MGFCPFRSGINKELRVSCMESTECQIWSETHNNCSLNAESIQAIFQKALEQISKKLEEIYMEIPNG